MSNDNDPSTWRRLKGLVSQMGPQERQLVRNVLGVVGAATMVILIARVSDTETLMWASVAIMVGMVIMAVARYIIRYDTGALQWPARLLLWAVVTIAILFIGIGAASVLYRSPVVRLVLDRYLFSAPGTAHEYVVDWEKLVDSMLVPSSSRGRSVDFQSGEDPGVNLEVMISTADSSELPRLSYGNGRVVTVSFKRACYGAIMHFTQGIEAALVFAKVDTDEIFMIPVSGGFYPNIARAGIATDRPIEKLYIIAEHPNGGGELLKVQYMIARGD